MRMIGRVCLACLLAVFPPTRVLLKSRKPKFWNSHINPNHSVHFFPPIDSLYPSVSLSGGSVTRWNGECGIPTVHPKSSLPYPSWHIFLCLPAVILASPPTFRLSLCLSFHLTGYLTKVDAAQVEEAAKIQEFLYKTKPQRLFSVHLCLPAVCPASPPSAPPTRGRRPRPRRSRRSRRPRTWRIINKGHPINQGTCLLGEITARPDILKNTVVTVSN